VKFIGQEEEEEEEEEEMQGYDSEGRGRKHNE